MKEKLIEEFKGFQINLKGIDANYNNIRENNSEHKKHSDTLRNIELILSDILNRINRFYTEKYQYFIELDQISKILKDFRVYYGETHMYLGLTMEDCKIRIIGILDGIINELTLYDTPSNSDLKFNKL